MTTQQKKPVAAPPAEPEPKIPQELLDMAVPDDDVVDADIVDDPTLADGAREPDPSTTQRATVATAEPGTDVEVHRPGGSLVADDEWSDIDEMDLSPSERFVIPLYQLNRKIDGGFVNEDTGEIVRQIDAVLMAKVNTRAWWAQRFGVGDQAPACRSDDGVTANTDRSPAQQAGWEMPKKDGNGEPPATVCGDCPNSQWDGDSAPACAESIEFLAFVPTDLGAGRVVRLRFGGMALGPARRYWESFRTRLPKRPPIAYVTRIALDEVETDNGAFLVPTFRRVDDISRDEAEPILAARELRQLDWRHAVSTDDRADRAAVDDAGPFDSKADGTSTVPFPDDDGREF